MPSCQCRVEFAVKPDLVYEHTIIYCPTHAQAHAMVALLDEVTSCLETVMVHYGPDMPWADQAQRGQAVMEARALLKEIDNG